MKIYDIPSNFGYRTPEAGMFSFISRNEELIKKVTDKENVAIKIFFQPTSTVDLSDYFWGRPFRTLWNDEEPREERSRLLMAVKIQNLFWSFGLAPRVYDIFLVRHENLLYPALLVDSLDSYNFAKSDEEVTLFFNKMLDIGNEIGVYPTFHDLKRENLVCEKWIDFQAWHFSIDYEQRMIERYNKLTQWSGNVYQGIDGDILTKAYRGEERWKLIEYLHNYDWKGKTVADIGCNGGQFSRIASFGGAKKVLAYDFENVVAGAFEASNYVGAFNIDFFGGDISKGIDVPEVDVMFYLSVYRYFGFAPFLLKAKTVIYEHNGDVELEVVINEFKEAGYKVEEDFGVTGKNDSRKSLVFVKI